jgi:protein-tyrosine phosphatase
LTGGRHFAPLRHRLLLVCTGNQCRSPMAMTLARAWFDEHDGAAVDIESAGTMLDADGRPASDGALRSMEKRGLDLADHISRPVSVDMVERADLVLTMERAHVRALVTMEPDAYPRTFTLLEFARRSATVQPRRSDQPLADWLVEVQTGRTPRDLLGASDEDDIADPIGRRQGHYHRCADQIDEALDASLTAAFACD